MAVTGTVGEVADAGDGRAEGGVATGAGAGVSGASGEGAVAGEVAASTTAGVAVAEGEDAVSWAERSAISEAASRTRIRWEVCVMMCAENDPRRRGERLENKADRNLRPAF